MFRWLSFEHNGLILILAVDIWLSTQINARPKQTQWQRISGRRGATKRWKKGFRFSSMTPFSVITFCLLHFIIGYVHWNAWILSFECYNNRIENVMEMKRATKYWLIKRPIGDYQLRTCIATSSFDLVWSFRDRDRDRSRESKRANTTTIFNY